MKRTLLIVIILGAMVLLGAAGWLYAHVITSHATNRHSPGSDPVRIYVGDTYEVRLSSNITTGYRWNASFDDTLLELVEDYYVDSETGLIGAGGIQVLVFRGLAAGTTTVLLEYERPWEGVPEESEEITFDIQ